MIDRLSMLVLSALCVCVCVCACVCVALGVHACVHACVSLFRKEAFTSACAIKLI